VYDCSSGPATCVFNSYGSTAESGGNPGTEMLGFAVSATMITYPSTGIFIVAGAPNHKGSSSGNNGDYSGSYTWYFYAVSSGTITASYYHSGEFGTSSSTEGSYGGMTVATYPGFAGFVAGTAYWTATSPMGPGAWLYYCPSSLTTSSSTDTTGGCTVRLRISPTTNGIIVSLFSPHNFFISLHMGLGRTGIQLPRHRDEQRQFLFRQSAGLHVPVLQYRRQSDCVANVLGYRNPLFSTVQRVLLWLVSIGRAFQPFACGRA